ncbi:DNA polymerase I [Candidatus Saccharibacteria bacterium]|nr:DNA polymerase I [Candidatus Saccharibacteria bacterium]
MTKLTTQNSADPDAAPSVSNPKNFAIVDGKSVFYRGYYAMGHLSLPDGTPTGGVFGFATMLLEIIEKLQPEYLAVAWDKSKTNIRRRRKLYPDYKANRKPAPPDFYAQIPYLMQLLDAFDIPLYEFDDYEADDIIGTLARSAKEQGIETNIISGDFDMLQIVDEHIKMFKLERGFSDVEIFDVSALEEKYGLKKEQFLDLKSLKGDSSDNIPGVPGIGEKTAIKLLQDYQTLDKLYASLDQLKGTLRQKLESGRDSAYLSKQLASIQFDAPIAFDSTATKLADFTSSSNKPTQTPTKHSPITTSTSFDPSAVLNVLEQLQFRSLIKKFVKLFPSAKSAITTKSAQPNQPLTSTISANSSNPAQSLIPTQPPKNVVKNTTQPQQNVVENTTPHISLPKNLYLSHNVKSDMHDDKKLAAAILQGKTPFWDLGQVAFLLDPLAHKRAQLDLSSLEDPKTTYQNQQAALSALPKLKHIATDLDFPLIPVLYKMERQGVQIDPARFKALEVEFSTETTSLEQEIHALAGQSFNLNSPFQLSDILFDTLKLPTKGIKKNRRAYSTGSKELAKLHGAHPIIAKIERYREASKLLSTYIQPLPALADQNHRIHTTFTQDVTATGRLSSINPNLQNIPVRSEDGKRIRSCFIAPKNRIFISADYAQFELRLAAALAGDQALIDDFNAGLDIHTKTAADAFHVTFDEVTKDQRRAAKVINFGVLYGMSARGLAEAANMSFSEAKSFIERYFELRAPIRNYIDQTLDNGRKNGYVETLFGRRRPTPDLSAPNYLVRSAAERAAANMPIQGTEADLIKKAMLAVDRTLPENVHLILQIHDSLIVECDESDEDKVAKILRENMESVAPDLPVKLAVDIHSGPDWSYL